MNSLRDVSDYYSAKQVDWGNVRALVSSLTPSELSTDPDLPGDFATAYNRWESASQGIPTALALTPDALQDITPDNGTYAILQSAVVPALADLSRRATIAAGPGGNGIPMIPVPQPQAPDWSLSALQALDATGIPALGARLVGAPGSAPLIPTWAQWALGGAAGIWAATKLKDLLS